MWFGFRCFTPWGHFIIYAWAESHKCFALNPESVESTNSCSLGIVIETIEYKVNTIVAPATQFETLALENTFVIIRGGFCYYLLDYLVWIPVKELWVLLEAYTPM